MTELTRPTARGRQTLEAIDAAARKVIADKGFLKMTVADIAEEAGKSPGSFYNYYDSKEALLEHWAREFQHEASERLMAARDGASSPREGVLAVARAHWETYRRRLAEMIGIFQLAMINDDFARFWDDLCEQMIGGITVAVRAAQNRGHCPDVDARLTATAIVSMMNMFCYEKLANGAAEDVDDEACIATLASIWYHAVYWTPTDG